MSSQIANFTKLQAAKREEIIDAKIEERGDGMVAIFSQIKDVQLRELAIEGLALFGRGMFYDGMEETNRVIELINKEAARQARENE